MVTEGDILQAKIVLASIYSKKGEWNEVLNMVPGEDEVGEGFTPPPGKTDYMNIMRIKALVLKGRSFAMSIRSPITDASRKVLHSREPPRTPPCRFKYTARPLVCTLHSLRTNPPP